MHITHYIVPQKHVGLTILCPFSDFLSMYFLNVAIFGNEISPQNETITNSQLAKIRL